MKPSKCFELEEDAGVLRREVKRLEVKVSGLNSQVEGQTKELEGLNEEVFLFYFILFMAAFRRVLRREVKRLLCWDLDTGSKRWQRNLLSER